MNKLSKWLNMRAKTKKDLAAEKRAISAAIGVDSSTLSRYLSGKQKPRRNDVIIRITAYTDGFVTANDFYGD